MATKKHKKGNEEKFELPVGLSRPSLHGICDFYAVCGQTVEPCAHKQLCQSDLAEIWPRVAKCGVVQVGPLVGPDKSGKVLLFRDIPGYLDKKYFSTEMDTDSDLINRFQAKRITGSRSTTSYRGASILDSYQGRT